MATIDYAVLLIYLAGIFGVGCLFAVKNKSSADMFAAGGQSPWWTSGLSAFMTMFSANTFVVWGGIAYRQGMVAVLINLMYGVAAMLVGYFVAGRWKKIGVQTPAEYVQLRFGDGVLHFYTWFMTVFKMVTTAGALYALGRILVSLMPLSEGNPLRDPETGNLSLFYGIIIFSSIVVIYTMIGGLWAVLMTDVFAIHHSESGGSVRDSACLSQSRWDGCFPGTCGGNTFVAGQSGRGRLGWESVKSDFG